MLTIYSAQACPFAQRPRALLSRLEQPFTLREIDLANKPADFLALSPSTKVPLLTDGDLKLYESYVINEYLAEKFGWKQAYTADVGLRARQRLAMLQFDEVVVSAHYRAIATGKPPEGAAKDALHRALQEQERTVEESGGAVDNLFGIHVAPHWARMRWAQDESAVMDLIEEFVSLTEWLDDAVAMPHIQSTLPPREEYLAGLRAKFKPAKG